MKFTTVISFAALSILLLMTGCNGGGGGGSSEPKIILKGTVQKGLFSQLQVVAFPINEMTGELGEPVETTSTNSEYELGLPENGFYQIQATGTFINEITGEETVLEEPLMSVVEVDEAEENSNVNLYTHIAALQVISNLENGGELEEVIAEADTFVHESLGLQTSVVLTELDITAITETSGADDPDLQLLLFSAGVLQHSQSGTLNRVIGDFGAYDSPLDAANGLSILGGTSAATLYEIVQPYLTALPESLPALEENLPIFICATNCGWQLYTQPTVSISGANLFESNGKAILTISLSRALDEDIQLTLSSSDVSASKGMDYKPVAQTITIPAHQLSVEYTADLIIDNSDEQTETVRYQISSSSDAYGIAQGFRDIGIINGYGPRQTFTTDPVEISSICLSGVGDGLNIESEGCLDDNFVALIPSDTSALAIDLSMQINCDPTASECMSAARRNWLVDLSLETLSESGSTVQQTQNLGFYWFPMDKLHKTSQSQKVDTVYAHLGSNQLALFDTAQTQNLSMRITGKLVETSHQLSQTDELEPPVLLPSEIIAGDQTLGYVVNSVSQSTGCEGDSYLVDAEYSLDNDLYLHAELCIKTTQGTNGELLGYLEAGQQLDLAGSKITLPAFHSSHIVYGDNLGNRLQSLGADYLVMPSVINDGAAETLQLCNDIDCFKGQGLSGEAESQALSLYLHAEGLPFAFRITSGYLDNTGIHLNYSARKYLHFGEFAQHDTRHPDKGENIKSNDIFYKESGSGSFLLSNLGIDEQISMSDSNGLYAFPKASIIWQDFDFSIANSKISGLNSISSQFVLYQSPKCEGCASVNPLVYLLQGDLSLDGKGKALATMSVPQSSSAPSWGRVSAQRAFQRPADLVTDSTATVSLPGYIFDLPEGDGVDSLLLGHIEQKDGNLIHHGLKTDTAALGNEWPTGISLGPQLYSNASGEPEVGTGRFLNDGNLDINNGIDDTFEMAVNTGAKYVIRNSGITGVFNLDIDPNNSDPTNMFDYEMYFSRFAFRLADNNMDDYSWIDGRVHLPGNGNFDTEFTSLSLGCDAKFGPGVVTYCDNPGCQQSLGAWHADTKISNMEFVGESGEEAQACVAESQQLSLNQTAEMYALNDENSALKPVGIIKALWSPAGEIISSNLAPLQEMILDEKTTKKGFAIGPRSGGLELLSEPENYGVIELKDTDLVASQFWDRMRTDIRLANNDANTESAPSVVVGAGHLSHIPEESNITLADKLIEGGMTYSRFSPDAEFTWNGSSFGFSLPVYYSTGLNAEQASFYGRYKKADLLIMEAGAGIDYIKPNSTHLSFGVSANIPELGSLPLRVDLSDLVTLENVDSLLGEFSINLDLEDYFTNTFPLQPKLESILNMGSSGILYAIKETLDEILSQSAETQIDGFDVNLWEEIAEPITALQSIPLQLDVVLDASVSQSFETDIFQTSLELRADFEILQDLLNDYRSTPVTNVDITRLIAQAIARIRSQLQPMIEANSQILSKLDAVRRQVLAIVDTTNVNGEISRQIARLDAAINKISGAGGGILQRAFNIEQEICNGSLLPENALFLKPAIAQIQNVADTIDLFEDVSNIVSIVGLLYAGESELNQQFLSTVEEINLTAQLLKSDFEAGEASIYGAICGNGSTDNYLANALDYFDQLQTQINSLSTQLETVQQATGSIFSAALDRFNFANIVIQNLDDILAAAGQQLINPVVTDDTAYTVGTIDDQIFDAINDLLPETEDISINALFAADGNGQADLHLGIILPLHLQLEGIPRGIRGLVPQLSFSGAYFSADEYKDMIINRIMNSQGIGDIRNDINQFLQSYIDEIVGAQLKLGDQINLGIKAQLAKLASPINNLISEATAELPIPIKAAGLDGQALITADQLTQLHVQAEFETPGQDEDVKGNKFTGAFDAYRQTADDDSENCGTGGEETFTAGISATGPIEIGDSNPDAKVGLQFIFQPNNSGASAFLPVGLNGGFSLIGPMEYETFVLRDFGFAAGIGLDEVYLGAGGTGVFETTELGLYAFVGRTCKAEVITDIDNDVAEYISIDSPFLGIYGRGRATIPLVDYSCALNAQASANIGSWITVEPVPEFGGIIGGALMGELACIGSIRGQVDTAAAINTRGDLFFAGRAFAVAGVGPDCDSGEWTSKSRSRNDDWCGTADISIDVKYEDNAWETEPQSPSALH